MAKYDPAWAEMGELRPVHLDAFDPEELANEAAEPSEQWTVIEPRMKYYQLTREDMWRLTEAGTEARHEAFDAFLLYSKSGKIPPFKSRAAGRLFSTLFKPAVDKSIGAAQMAAQTGREGGKKAHRGRDSKPAPADGEPDQEEHHRDDPPYAFDFDSFMDLVTAEISRISDSIYGKTSGDLRKQVKAEQADVLESIRHLLTCSNCESAVHSANDADIIMGYISTLIDDLIMEGHSTDMTFWKALKDGLSVEDADQLSCGSFLTASGEFVCEERGRMFGIVNASAENAVVREFTTAAEALAFLNEYKHTQNLPL